jgi:hypothetical protein
MRKNFDLSDLIPRQVGRLDDPQRAIPRIAKDPKLTALIEATLRTIPTKHILHRADARRMEFLETENIELATAELQNLNNSGTTYYSSGGRGPFQPNRNQSREARSAK